MSHHEAKDMAKVIGIGLIDIEKTLQPSIRMPANSNQLCPASRMRIFCFMLVFVLLVFFGSRNVYLFLDV